MAAPTTIVVPCFNEAERIDLDAFEQALSQMPWLHLLFVDDGSRDDTLALLTKLQQRLPQRVSLLSLSCNQGKPEAVRRGVVAALQHDAVELVGYWDADLSTPLSELGPMCELLCQRDALMVVGSRVKLLGRQITRELWRHYVGRVFATLASVTLGLPVYDTQCGAKVFRAGELTRQLFAQPFMSRWIFDVELLARLLLYARIDPQFDLQQKVIEQPLQRWTYAEGSKLGPGDYLRSVADLAAINHLLHLSGHRWPAFR